MTPANKPFTLSKLAAYFGVSDRAIYKRMQAGHLPPADLSIFGRQHWSFALIEQVEQGTWKPTQPPAAAAAVPNGGAE